MHNHVQGYMIKVNEKMIMANDKWSYRLSFGARVSAVCLAPKKGRGDEWAQKDRDGWIKWVGYWYVCIMMRSSHGSSLWQRRNIWRSRRQLRWSGRTRWPRLSSRNIIVLRPPSWQSSTPLPLLPSYSSPSLSAASRSPGASWAWTEIDWQVSPQECGQLHRGNRESCKASSYQE